MSTVNQSPELTAFYRAYLDWLNDGAPEGHPFHRDTGLCFNVREYAKNYGFYRSVMQQELEHQFQDAGLDIGYPFQSMGAYDERTWDKTQHLCPARRAWVEEHAK